MNYGLTEPSSGSRPNMRSNKLPLGLIGVLGAILFLAIVYALMLPALSSSSAAYCGSDEHIHGEDCLTQTLICGYHEEDIPAENTTHQHGDECYTVEKVLVCEIAEVSSLPDGDGESDQAVYPPSEEAILIEAEPLTDLQADIVEPIVEENAPEAPASEIHVHDSSCYEEMLTLVCELPESEEKIEEQPAEEAGGESPHVHSDACYESECAYGLEEHTHNLQCFSNPSADLETAADWESTLPVEDSLTGVWADDLIAIAESQLGYSESIQNYLVVDGDKTKGYTRYGEWYGDVYGDWCAMFVSFCLNYVGIPVEAVPRDSNCQNWIDQLAGESYAMYYSVGAYAEEGAEPFEPVPGDLIFFDWNNDAVSDHVGIVAEIIEAEDGAPVKVKTIEGNSSNVVKYREYEIDNATIMGYASLPINNGEEASTMEATSGSGVSALHDEGNVYHSVNEKIYYQVTYYPIGTGVVGTFALVPAEGERSAADFAGFVHNPTDWTAKTAENYVVAYCADHETGTSGRLSKYTVYKLDNSRIANDENRQQLAAVVANSYPFITAQDMKDRMAAAGYLDLGNCDESELISGVQHAIWSITSPTSAIDTAVYSETANGWLSYCVNGIALEDIERKDETTFNRNIFRISEYLTNLTPVENLKVEDCTSSCVLNESGTYDLTVKVKLTRPIYANEIVTASLSAAKESSDINVLSKGVEEFVLKLENIDAQELASSSVSLQVSGEHVQAYFYDSSSYQDMIGGNWEEYAYDLSFAVGSPKMISLSVSKVWAGDEGAESVEVSLLANGVELGDPVELKPENSWSYEWGSLPKQDLLGNDIVYSVKEKAVDGYLPYIEKVEGGISATKKGWVKLAKDEDFVAGGEYLLLSSSGALLWEKDSSKGGTRGALAWGRASLANPDETSDAAIWVAEQSGSGVVLKNKAKSASYNFYPYFMLGGYYGFTSSEPTAVSYPFIDETERVLASGNRYLSKLTDMGAAVPTESKEAALPLTVYKLDSVDSPVADISYLITNYKVEDYPVPLVGDFSIKKVSSSDTDKVLMGAEFDLYMVDEEAGTALPGLGIEEPVVKLNTESLSVDADGVVAVENIEIGTRCYLVETKAPAGYNLLSCPILFTVGGSADALKLTVVSGTPGHSWAFVDDEASNVLVVKNADGYALPETGGTGVAPLMAVGMILLAGASLLLLRQRSEERRPLPRP